MPSMQSSQPAVVVDFSGMINSWLLFFAMGCGTGSGLTASNNLAQMAESLGSRTVGAFVALVSVWNFLGRLGSGYISEYYVKQYTTPRPVFLFCVQEVMACAHLLFASSVTTMLYLASILVGLAHGAHWTLMVATSSELFGLKNFGAFYNTLSISATVGSYLLSVKLAGYIYDQQVASLQAAAIAAGQDLTGPQKRVGPQYFSSTFLVMASVCGLGDSVSRVQVYKFTADVDSAHILFNKFPWYLGFVKGVVDSSDLPLNVSREILQESRIVRIMKKRLVRKTFDVIEESANPEKMEAQRDLEDVIHEDIVAPLFLIKVVDYCN